MIINYVCSVFSHWLCFHHSSNYSMQEDSSIQLNTHQSTVHRKVYVCCCGGRMHCCLAAPAKAEQSSQFRLLIAMSTCDVDQAALATSAAQCVGIFGIMESILLAPLHLCSPLVVGVGFPPLLTFFSCCYHWFPMYDDSTKRNSHAILMASTSLECFHFFWNICIYIRTVEIQSSFHCALKQEQKILWNHGTRKS